MIKYNILVSDTALKQFRKLDTSTGKRVRERLQNLRDDPFHRRAGMDIKQLVGFRNPDVFRLRVGNYRVVYVVAGVDVKITEIVNRSSGYNWLN
ncbi:MAG: type II toxin-antitoxin system RelE/ParE family toxin [Candidatus Aenigmarchaeota archaeon]|nr:type II toxin-antitoxin system RelE/ParE family toxin [Candidatus Aenigmarchaeota archaeon]